MLQIKPLPPSLLDSYDWIYPGDPALNQEADGFIDAWELAQATGDYGKVPLLEGQKPTIFTLRNLTDSEQRYLRDRFRSGDHNQAMRLACELGLEKVSDLMDERGRKVDLGHALNNDGRRVVAPQHMDLLARIDGLIDLIGVTVIGRLSPTGK